MDNKQAIKDIIAKSKEGKTDDVRQITENILFGMAASAVKDMKKTVAKDMFNKKK